MKYYHPTGVAEEVRLGETELISAGEEILSRARMLGEALARKVENTVDRDGFAGAGNASPRQAQNQYQ